MFLKNVLLVLCATQILFFSTLLQAEEQLLTTSGPIVVATINGTINPATDDYLKSSLQQAIGSKASLYVLELNTPGGVLTSMQTMVESLLQSSIPTVVYVTPGGGGAISAGVFVTMAGHFAVMTPGTTIGAAHPVSGGGQDVEGDMRAKIENFSATLAKAIAEQRQRNVEWAEKAVRESVAITDSEAVKEHVVDFTAKDFAELLEKLEGRKVILPSGEMTLTGLSTLVVQRVPMTFRQQVVNFLSDPNIALLLGMAAMLGLGIEFYHPGGVIPGVIGAVCLILSLTAGQVIPINQGGALLLILGAVFMIVEVAVPSFGIWGIAGTVCLALGAIYFVDNTFIWSAEGFEVNTPLITSGAIISGIIFIFFGSYIISVRRRKVTTGLEGLMGQLAEARAAFICEEFDRGYSGKVNLRGEIWSARCLDPVVQSELVRVTGMEAGNRLLVERVAGKSDGN
ncbi:MAG: nodulation protein NfeD [bacterium]|nr:nodulation protein NfeD [bacterium]